MLVWGQGVGGGGDGEAGIEGSAGAVPVGY